MSYKCIGCDQELEAHDFGENDTRYDCGNIDCPLCCRMLMEKDAKALDKKRKEYQALPMVRRIVDLEIERDGYKELADYWIAQAANARIGRAEFKKERDEARQIARQMKAERDNALAQYELLKKVLGPEV